jgi:hypothetical protein
MTSQNTIINYNLDKSFVISRLHVDTVLVRSGVGRSGKLLLPFAFLGFRAPLGPMCLEMGSPLRRDAALVSAVG